MQLDVFALEDDIAMILDYLLQNQGFRFFEGYSETNKAIREFTSIDDWQDARRNKGRCLLLRGWHSSFTNAPIFKKIIHSPTIGGERSCLEGVAIMQIKESFDEGDGNLRRAIISHWNEAGARQRSSWSDQQLNEVNWPQMRKLSGRLQRHIKNNIAVAKVRSYPILPAAYKAFQAGNMGIWCSDKLVTLGSDLIVST